MVHRFPFLKRHFPFDDRLDKILLRKGGRYDQDMGKNMEERKARPL